MISVIVVAFNAEHTIARCVESVLNQTFTNWELLIVNDGSIDNTLDIVNGYAKNDLRIKVSTHENRGISFSRQEALDMSKGEYTIFVDADDWVEPEYLSSLYCCAQESKADMIICDFWIERENKTEYSCQRPKVMSPDIILGQMLSDLHGSLWNKLISKEAYKRTGVRFLHGLNCCEDQYVILALLANSITVAYVSKPLYHYDKTNVTSITNNWLSFPVDKRIYFIDNIRPFISTDYQLRCFSNYIGRIAYDAVVSPKFACPDYRCAFKTLWPQISQSEIPSHKKFACYLGIIGLRMPIRVLRILRNKIYNLLYE